MHSLHYFCDVTDTRKTNPKIEKDFTQKRQGKILGEILGEC